MDGVRLLLTTPRRIDPSVRRLFQAMQLPESNAVWLELHRPKAFSPERAECHINALVQQKLQGGHVASGWAIWQDRSNEFVEAQFHTVWLDPNGHFKDVTPRQDRESRILFVPDARYGFALTHVDGQPAVDVYDTVRMHRATLLNGPEPRVHVCVTDLIYEYGLASRKDQGQASPFA